MSRAWTANLLAFHFSQNSFHTYVSRLHPLLTPQIVVKCNSVKALKENPSLLIEWETIWRILQSYKTSLQGVSHWYSHVHFQTKIRVMDCLILFHWCQVFKNCFVINEFVPKNFLESLPKLGLCNSRTLLFLGFICCCFLLKSIYTVPWELTN